MEWSQYNVVATNMGSGIIQLYFNSSFQYVMLGLLLDPPLKFSFYPYNMGIIKMLPNGVLMFN